MCCTSLYQISLGLSHEPICFSPVTMTKIRMKLSDAHRNIFVDPCLCYNPHQIQLQNTKSKRVRMNEMSANTCNRCSLKWILRWYFVDVQQNFLNN